MTGLLTTSTPAQQTQQTQIVVCMERFPIKHFLGVESGDQSSSANVIPNTMRPLEKTQTSVMLEFSVNTKTSSRKL